MVIFQSKYFPLWSPERGLFFYKIKKINNNFPTSIEWHIFSV